MQSNSHPYTMTLKILFFIVLSIFITHMNRAVNFAIIFVVPSRWLCIKFLKDFFLIRGHDLTKLLFFFVRKVILKSIKRRGNENVKPQNKIIQVLKFPSLPFLKFPTSKSKKDFYFVVSFKWSRNIAGKS